MAKTAKTSVRLGSGSAFWGDATDPAAELLREGKLDYLCFDYLAELTMSLLERQRQKDPEAGFVGDAIEFQSTLLNEAQQCGTRLISNAGGANPSTAAKLMVKLARQKNLSNLKIAAVEGDNIVDRLGEIFRSGIKLDNMDTGQPFESIHNRVVSASVYTGADGIVEALELGADVVLAGRVSDNAPYVGALMHEFGWKHGPDHADLVGGGITLGHVVECAAGCTGGMSSRWAEMPSMGKAGFPILEVDSDGTAVVTKCDGTGGRVDEFTIKEHLLYEIGDPKNYVMPDGVADFTTVQVREVGPDRVHLSGMSGKSRPDNFKVLIGYNDGWIGEGMLFFPWPDAIGRANKARETLLERFERMELKSKDIHFDLVGVNMLHGPAAAPDPTVEPNEVGLRVAVRTESRDEAEKVRRACANLWIMGPGGTSFGVPLKPRPVVAIWPTLIPRSLITHTVNMFEV